MGSTCHNLQTSTTSEDQVSDPQAIGQCHTQLITLSITTESGQVTPQFHRPQTLIWCCSLVPIFDEQYIQKHENTCFLPLWILLLPNYAHNEYRTRPSLPCLPTPNEHPEDQSHDPSLDPTPSALAAGMPMGHLGVWNLNYSQWLNIRQKSAKPMAMAAFSVRQFLAPS